MVVPSAGAKPWCEKKEWRTTPCPMARVLAMAHHSMVRAKASRLWLTTLLNSGAIPNLVPNSIFLTFFSMAPRLFLSFFLDSLFCVCLSFNMSIHGYSDEDYDAGSDGDNVTLISKLDISNPLHLAKHVWDELKETYDKVDGSVTFNLHHKINSLSQNGSSIADYYHKLNALWKQFDALVQLPRCTCHAAEDFKKHNSLMKLMQFLMGLDDSYMPIRSNILSRDPLPDVRGAYAIISSEESHRVVSTSNVGTSQRPNNVTRPSGGGNRRTNGGPQLVCENCGFNGHTIDRCFKIIGYPTDFGKRNNNNNQGTQNFNRRFINNNSVGSSSSSTFSDDQLSKIISLIKDNSLNNGKGVQANMAGTILNKSKLFHKNFNRFFCSNSQLHSALVAAGVIVDSGANQHLTYTDKFLVNVVNISNLGITVSHTKGDEAVITSVGDMVLSRNLTLYDVLVVPDYCVSLMSVHKVARDSGLIIAFNENKCFVLPQDLREMKILGTGNQIDGLYYFNNGDVQGINTGFEKLNCNLSKYIWHSRLGHPSDQVLKVLEHELVFDNCDLGHCEICQRSKQTREPFPLSEHKSSVLVELVHLDLWGPYRIASKEGFRYFLTIVDDYTRLPSSVLNGKTPFELVFNRKPGLKHLRVFGCLCYATVLNLHDKLGSRAEKCVLVGYASFKKGYKLYSLERKQFIYSRDVKFFEKVFPFKIRQTQDTNLTSQGLDHVNFFNEIVHEDLDTSNDEPSKIDAFVASESIPESVPTTSSPHVRRSERTSVFPRKYNDFVIDSKVKYGLENYVSYVNLSVENKCFTTELNKSLEPRSFFEASKDQHWIEAMNNEMDALYRNDTWEIVELPFGRKAIGGKWVYKIKYKSSGDIDRYKARYVAKGYNQKEGIDFDETFSPVVKIVTVRCVINLAVQYDWSIFQLDVNNAFLRLLRQWNAKLTQSLIEHGFIQSKSDYSLFTKSESGKFMVLLVYVDDIIITGNNVFSGTEVIDTDRGLMFVNTMKICCDLLSDFGLLACKPSTTPLEQNLTITNEPSSTDPVLDNVTEYQKLIGRIKLIYLNSFYKA
ncbi:ribonuclease H-like domain-containing protein [Tanacetum coccineum]